MKAQTFDKQSANDFMNAGMRRRTAKVVVALLNAANPLSARDLEKTSDLRQPEVSLALTEIRSMGWLKEEEKDTTTTIGSRDHPQGTRKTKLKMYSLQITLDGILDNLRSRFDMENSRVTTAISKIKERTSS